MLGSWIVVWGSVSCVGTDRWNKKGIWIFSKIENSDSLFYIRSDGVNVGLLPGTSGSWCG